jgi:hypothetical protein
MNKFIAICFLAAFAAAELSAQMPSLSRREIRQGWTLLFDGQTSNGWTSWRQGRDFPETGWTIKDGILTIEADARVGDIITVEEFQDFELSLEFRISSAANSGIKYFILPNSTLGLEFQILDDFNHPDAKEGRDGNRLQGGLYDMLPPKANKKQYKPIGEWNHARIISRGNKIEHWLNGVKVVEVERFSAEWNDLLSKSKYTANNGWGTPRRSPILLQDHRDEVSFRNIKIRRF